MKKLELDLITAKKLYKTAASEFKILLEKNFGKESFSDKIYERITTLEEVYAELEIEEEDFLPFSIKTKDLFEQKINNIARLKKVEECYCQDWKPNWNNNNYKYYPYFYKSSGGSLVVLADCCYGDTAFYGSLALYPTNECALAAGNNFKDLYLKIRS